MNYIAPKMVSTTKSELYRKEYTISSGKEIFSFSNKILVLISSAMASQTVRRSN